MRKVRLSGIARAFLQREAKYLRERSPSAAETFLSRLREARRNLVGDYILDYDLDKVGVAIASIRHARQSDPDIGHDADLDFEIEADALAGKPMT
jgi:hypothetical protein